MPRAYAIPPISAWNCCRWAATKGAALEKFSSHLGLTMASCLVFGDAMNGKEMLAAG